MQPSLPSLPALPFPFPSNPSIVLLKLCGPFMDAPANAASPFWRRADAGFVADSAGLLDRCGVRGEVD